MTEQAASELRAMTARELDIMQRRGMIATKLYLMSLHSKDTAYTANPDRTPETDVLGAFSVCNLTVVDYFLELFKQCPNLAVPDIDIGCLVFNALATSWSVPEDISPNDDIGKAMVVFARVYAKLEKVGANDLAKNLIMMANPSGQPLPRN
jgi:hypothetical protein